MVSRVHKKLSKRVHRDRGGWI